MIRGRRKKVMDDLTGATLRLVVFCSMDIERCLLVSAIAFCTCLFGCRSSSVADTNQLDSSSTQVRFVEYVWNHNADEMYWGLTADGEVVNYWFEHASGNSAGVDRQYCTVGRIDPSVATATLNAIASLPHLQNSKSIWGHPDAGDGHINVGTIDDTRRCYWDETQQPNYGGVFTATDEQIATAGEWMQAKLLLARAVGSLKQGRVVTEIEDIPQVLRGDAESISDLIRVGIWRGRESH